MHTGSFGDLPKKHKSRNIKVDQIFLLSKNRSWALVDARNFFWGQSLIRACTGSFGNLYGDANLRNINMGQIFGLSKIGSWTLVDAHHIFGGFIN